MATPHLESDSASVFEGDYQEVPMLCLPVFSKGQETMFSKKSLQAWEKKNKMQISAQQTEAKGILFLSVL